jgi:hypothetical protein
MFYVKGILRKEDVETFTRKDGTEGSKRVLYVEPEGSVFPTKINCSDMDMKVGKVGETVNLPIEVFAYYFEDGKRKRAYKDVYIPKKK